MATQYDPIAKDESLNTTESPSRNVADVLAEELQNIAQAIGGGGSGGHTIEGADGTALSQEPTLQFADADATDDAVNEKTVVNVVRKRTQAQYDAMSAADKAKGIIEITDADAKPLDASQVRYGDGTVEDALDGIFRGSVSVTTDGSKTWTAILNSLYAVVDGAKVNVETKLDLGGTIMTLMYYSSSQFVFIVPYFDETNGKSKSSIVNVKASGSSYVSQNGDSNVTNNSNSVPGAGHDIIIYY